MQLGNLFKDAAGGLETILVREEARLKYCI